MADALRRGDRGQLRRGRYAGRGHHAVGLPAPPPRPPYGAARGASRRSGPATSSPPAPPRPARRSRARPTSSQVLRDAGVVDAGGRGVCVILDAAETASPARGRPGRRHALRHPAADPDGRRPAPTWRTDGPAYEVMYLLDAADDAIAELRRQPSPGSATPWSWSAARGCGTSTSTSTTSAPRSRRASRPAARTGSGSPTSPSRSRRPRAAAAGRPAPIVAVAAGPGLAGLFEEAGAVVVRRRPRATGPRPGCCSRPSCGSGAAGGRRPAQRPRLGPRRPGRGQHRRGATTTSGSR